MKKYRDNAVRGEGSYKYFSGVKADPNQQTVFLGYLDAYLYQEGVSPANKEREEATIKSLENARNEWEQNKNTLNSDFNSLKTEINQWQSDTKSDLAKWSADSKSEHDDYVKTKSDELSKLEKSYRDWLKLEAPSRYWKARAKRYRDRGRWWVVGLTAFTIIISLFLSYVLYNMPDAFEKNIFKGEPQAIKGLIILATIISLGIYVVRVFSRMTFSSFHIQLDAEEREQLTLVYLALIAKGGVDEKERSIILQSLFSRVETGLLGDDSSPTMPMISTLVDQFTTKKTKS